MMKGEVIMNYLKINNGRGFFRNKAGEYKELDTITKEDILFLLDEATNSSTDFEMEEITDESIKNEAHKIIYKSIFQKFSNLLCNKKQFQDECDALYKDALQKYKPKIQANSISDCDNDAMIPTDLSAYKT